MKIVCVGDCGIDRYLPSGRMFCGGITANFARYAARLFAPDDEIHVISAIGTDPVAAGLVRQTFRKTRIHCHIAELRGRTPVQYIEVTADGERRFLRYDEGVLAQFRIDEYSAPLLRTADLVVVPVFEQNRDMFRSVMAIAIEGTVAVDFADFASHPDFAQLEAYLDRIDVAFFGLASSDDAIIARLAAIAAGSDTIIVVTLGAAGSCAYAGSQFFGRPADPVATVVDTTGAGDAFAAGFLSAYCRDEEIERCLAGGTRIAAIAVQRLGAYAE